MSDIPLPLPLKVLPFIFVFILVAALLALLWKKVAKPREGYPYTKKDTLFSNAERSFFGVLEQAVGEESRVFGKIRLADVLSVQPMSNRKIWWRAFSRVKAKHIDFLLCDPEALSIQAAVELDDGSHSREKRKSRDAFLDRACQAAGLPLIRIPAKKRYSVNEIREKLSGVLDLQKPETTNSREEERNRPETKENPGSVNTPSCPKCSSKMVKRQVKSGPKAGIEFWGCSRYPNCRGVVKISD